MPARANFKRQGFILAPHGTGNQKKPVSCTPSQEAELGGRLVFRSLVLFILPHTAGQKVTGRHSQRLVS